MTTLTVKDAIEHFGVEVLDHLDRQAEIPVLTGLQFQGDVSVVPAAGRQTAMTPVPAAGVAVVRGESGGNTHLLLVQGPAFWDAQEGDALDGLGLGILTVPAGSTAFLAHPEHSYSGIGAGTYIIGRQREQAAVVRMVAD